MPWKGSSERYLCGQGLLGDNLLVFFLCGSLLCLFDAVLFSMPTTWSWFTSLLRNTVFFRLWYTGRILRCGCRVGSWFVFVLTAWEFGGSVLKCSNFLFAVRRVTRLKWLSFSFPVRQVTWVMTSFAVWGST